MGDVLRVQTDFESSNSGNNRVTYAICHPQIKCSHQIQENQLRDSHYGQPTHPSENVLESEMLKLEKKIDISPWNYFSLSKVLLVPLVVIHETEQDSIKPHLSESLRLRRLS